MKTVTKSAKNHKVYIIAEVSQNHDGSLGQAHAFIDAVKETGADAIKFQTHIASKESTPLEPFRVNFSYEDATRYDYWKRMEFSKEQWKGLYDHATESGLDFLSSPFSIEALHMLDEIGIPMWKFGSGEVFNRALIDAAIKTKKTIILSTGLSTFSEIKDQVSYISNNAVNVQVLYCITKYPSMPNDINLKDFLLLKNELNCPVGLSDHSATIYPSLSAITLGASIIEVHVTMSPYMFGPDVKASVTLEQLRQIVEGCEFIEKMNNSSNSITTRSSRQEDLKKMFSKSIYYSKELNKDHILGIEDMIAKKPAIGIDSNKLESFVGKRLKCPVKADTPLQEKDLEEVN